MLSAALDDLVQNDLIQEVISVALVESTGEDLTMRLTRYPLPKD
jgi:hypothetical protein